MPPPLPPLPPDPNGYIVKRHVSDGCFYNHRRVLAHGFSTESPGHTPMGQTPMGQTPMGQSPPAQAQATGTTPPRAHDLHHMTQRQLRTQFSFLCNPVQPPLRFCIKRRSTRGSLPPNPVDEEEEERETEERLIDEAKAFADKAAAARAAAARAAKAKASRVSIGGDALEQMAPEPSAHVETAAAATPPAAPSLAAPGSPMGSPIMGSPAPMGPLSTRGLASSSSRKGSARGSAASGGTSRPGTPSETRSVSMSIAAAHAAANARSPSASGRAGQSALARASPAAGFGSGPATWEEGGGGAKASEGSHGGSHEGDLGFDSEGHRHEVGLPPSLPAAWASPLSKPPSRAQTPSRLGRDHSSAFIGVEPLPTADMLPRRPATVGSPGARSATRSSPNLRGGHASLIAPPLFGPGSPARQPQGMDRSLSSAALSPLRPTASTKANMPPNGAAMVPLKPPNHRFDSFGGRSGAGVLVGLRPSTSSGAMGRPTTARVGAEASQSFFNLVEGRSWAPGAMHSGLQRPKSSGAVGSPGSRRHAASGGAIRVALGEARFAGEGCHGLNYSAWGSGPGPGP